MSDQGLKSELPTEKRLSEAQAEGQFARTPDVQVVLILIAAYFAFTFSLRGYAEKISAITVGILGHLGKYAIQPDAVGQWPAIAFQTMFGFIAPIGLACGGAALLGGALQSRFRLSPKAIGFKFERLNPIEGFQRIFSKQGWVKLGTDVLKLVVVAAIMWSGVKRLLGDPIFFTPVGPDRLGGFINDSVAMLLGRFILALGAIAALNYFYQFRKVRSDLMMTKHEIKEERRSSDGDPIVKNALRAMSRRLMQKQMLQAVPTADVVVTNPTHFAVALKYDRGADKAPMILAKGGGAFARRIKQLAASHEVPMIENKPVARMLFKFGKVGQPIPLELYQAVAEILAFVYRTHRYYFHRLKERRAAETV